VTDPTDPPFDDLGDEHASDIPDVETIERVLGTEIDKPKKKGKKKKKTKVVVQHVIPTWVRWAAVATAAVVITLAVVAVSQRRHADDVTGEARDRTAAERIAGEFSQTLFTFDAARPTANLDRLKALATKAYQPKVDDARQTALAGSTGDTTEAAMSAQVTDVYLTELQGDEAHAVTRSDWVLKAGGQTLELDLYLLVDLKREGGAWKVDTVSALTAKQPPGATPTTEPGAATSTTAPIPTTTSTTR
jgi:hypothetical protein